MKVFSHFHPALLFYNTYTLQLITYMFNNCSIVCAANFFQTRFNELSGKIRSLNNKLIVLWIFSFWVNVSSLYCVGQTFDEF